MDVRLIFDPPAAGDWNMAMDEALLESAGREGQGGCLRFYSWAQPTLSLGYFQRHADRALHLPSRHCAMVRRSTGGGAIIHAQELTYSFTVPLSRHTDHGLTKLYFHFHETLIEELTSRGLHGTLWGSSRHPFAREEPFLCFLRRSEADVVVEEHKVAGSAQRRRRQGLLQHGSVLLRTTAASPELTGMEDILGQTIDLRELAERWAIRIAGRLNARLRVDHPSDWEVLSAKRWVADRFGCEAWNMRR